MYGCKGSSIGPILREIWEGDFSTVTATRGGRLRCPGVREKAQGRDMGRLFSTSFSRGDSCAQWKGIISYDHSPKGSSSRPILREIWGGDFLLIRVHVWGDFSPLRIQGRLLDGWKGIITRDLWLKGRLQSPNIEGETGGRLFYCHCYKGSLCPGVREILQGRSQMGRLSQTCLFAIPWLITIIGVFLHRRISGMEA
jgi:hypothetical protein